MSFLDMPSIETPHLSQEQQSVMRVLSSRHFTKSPLISSFLSYICKRALEDDSSRISEHEIAVHVFHRSADFDPREDNIVRTYARHLRKRLHEYYVSTGQEDPVRITVPKGGYGPVFFFQQNSSTAEPAQPSAVEKKAPSRLNLVHSLSGIQVTGRIATTLLLLAIYSAALAGFVWLLASKYRNPTLHREPTAPLWNSLFGESGYTYIVPSDAGFNLIEDLSQRSLPLADYINEDYLEITLPDIDPHSADDMRTQQFTNFLDLQIVAALERVPEFNPQKAIFRFPRDLHMDDLKSDNAILLGSEESNPWVGVAESTANFRIIARDGMKGATLINTHPRPGESASYVSHWNEPAHETFAVIDYLPNLSGTGHILILQGLDAAGTQAASEMLFHPATIAPILQRATRPGGALRPFEILLRARSLQSSATSTQIIASRIY